jgi:hypothetical protein
MKTNCRKWIKDYIQLQDFKTVINLIFLLRVIVTIFLFYSEMV